MCIYGAYIVRTGETTLISALYSWAVFMCPLLGSAYRSPIDLSVPWIYWTAVNMLNTGFISFVIMKMSHFFYMCFNAHNMQHDVASCELKCLLQLLKWSQVINDIKVSLRNDTLPPPVVKTGSPVEHTSITAACLPREDRMIYQSVLWGAAVMMQSDSVADCHELWVGSRTFRPWLQQEAPIFSLIFPLLLNPSCWSCFDLSDVSPCTFLFLLLGFLCPTIDFWLACTPVPFWWILYFSFCENSSNFARMFNWTQGWTDDIW